jgi:hypothetical protein
MAMTVQPIHLVAHLPLVLGVLRRLEVAPLLDGLVPPHPAHGLSCGREIEALGSPFWMGLMPSTRWASGWKSERW